MKENQFQKQVIRALEGYGAKVLNVHGHAMQARGWPDLYVAHRDWDGWLELKVGSNSCSTLQQIVIRDLRERDVPAFVLRLVTEGYVQLEDGDKTILTGMTWDFRHGNNLGSQLVKMLQEWL